MFHIPSLASHGFSFVVGQIETFIVFCLPIIGKFIYKKDYKTTYIKTDSLNTFLPNNNYNEQISFL